MVENNNNKKKQSKLPSINELRRVCQSPYMDPNGPLSEAFSRKTYYKVSIYFTWLFLHTNITPNKVTLISFLLGMIASFFIALPGYYPVIGVILYQFWFIFDIVDGEIARYRKLSSLTGAFIDRLNAAVTEASMIAALVYRTYIQLLDNRIIIFGILSIISILILKIIFAYLHIAALEPILHKKHAQMFKKLYKTELKNAKFLYEYLSGRPRSTFMRISELLIGHGLHFGLYTSIIIDVLLYNVYRIKTYITINIPSMFSLNLNLSYLYILAVGNILPIALVFLVAHLVKNKAAEGMFYQILEFLKNQCNS